jgi:hypothetical protein
VTTYQRIHFIIRKKLFHGLKNGTMKMRSLFDDERKKMRVPQACYYCGSTDKLSVDHLIPLARGSADDADNLIWACRSCNSSRGGRDMLAWMSVKNAFPSLLLLRRYLKLVTQYCEEHQLLDVPMADATKRDLPFDLSLIPHASPPLRELKLWVYPKDEGVDGSARTP